MDEITNYHPAAFGCKANTRHNKIFTGLCGTCRQSLPAARAWKHQGAGTSVNVLWRLRRNKILTIVQPEWMSIAISTFIYLMHDLTFRQQKICYARFLSWHAWDRITYRWFIIPRRVFHSHIHGCRKELWKSMTNIPSSIFPVMTHQRP